MSPEEVAVLWNKSKQTLASDAPVDTSLCMQWSTVETMPLYVTSPTSSGQDAQAYLWSSLDRTGFVTFRGTSSQKDVLADLDLRMVTGPMDRSDVQVHQGFYRQFASIEPEITAWIREQNLQRLILAGHSMGGAIAQIAAVHYADLFPYAKIECHTFGCPRTGNQAFVDRLLSPRVMNTRVVLENDPVPMIPHLPWWRHPSCILIDDRCVMRFQSADIPWFFRLVWSILHLDFWSPVQDHGCDVYIDRLHTLSIGAPSDESLKAMS
jgi:hypothetical protein